MPTKSTIPASRPRVLILAGPNGAGKTTAVPHLVRDAFQINEFVNADTIAAGLSRFSPDRVAIAAGRLMLARMKSLARERMDFAFETTLASRSFLPWLRALSASGYEVYLTFLWLDSPETAILRVANRVEQGGHFVPDAVVRRRYRAGLRNLPEYMTVTDKWAIHNGMEDNLYPLVAIGSDPENPTIHDVARWTCIHEAMSP